MERKQKASDMEAAMMLATHIENPCSVEVEGRTENIRYFYPEMAEHILPSFTNPFVREFLQNIMDQYTMQSSQ